MLINRSRKPSSSSRGGLATVELAVCLPVLTILVFGSIEAASFIFLKQSLNAAAYEGIREAVRIDSSNASAINRVNNVLDARRVEGYSIEFPEGDVSDRERGEAFSIQVSAPTEPNSLLGGRFIPNRNLTARIVMVKE